MTDEQTNPPAKKAWGRSIHDLWLENGEGTSDPHDPPRYGKGKHLHPAEWRLLQCATSGKLCFLGEKRSTSPTKTNKIRPSLLRFIALGGDENHPLHDHGVQLAGAYIDGDLDFQGTVLPENIHLRFCTLNGDLLIQDCCAETFVLSAFTLNTINGDRFECTGDLHLCNEFRSKSTVQLLGAKIGGDLNCINGSFEANDVSLQCDGLETKGSVFFDDGFTATGTVRLVGAKIGGALICTNGSFEARGVSLHCDRLETKATVFFDDGFTAAGTVRLVGANIGGDLACRNGRLLSPSQSLDIEGAHIAGALLLDDGFLALGTVDLTNSQVGTDFRCTHGTFSAKELAINAPNIKVGNSVYLNNECRMRGEVSFQSAEIGDSISFQGGSFETKGVINLRNASVGNMITWRGVRHMRGELNFANASCNSLNMDEKAWSQPSQIRLDNFNYDRFAELPEGCTPSFWKRWLERQPEKHLTSKFRPNPYQQLSKVLVNMGHEEEARSVRIERRERQRIFTRDHVPKPDGAFDWTLRVLADVWRMAEKFVTGHGYRPGLAVFWLLGLIVVGCGIYQWAAWQGIMTPTHPLIFKEAIWEGPLAETPKGRIPADCRENWVYPPDKIKTICSAAIASEYSTFSSIIYSLDTAIPVVNFRMEDDWSPRVVNWQTGIPEWSGWWVRTWEWVQIGLGWMFSLLFVSAISGVIRRD